MLDGHTLENLTVVADFDRTISQGHPGCETAFNVFGSTPGTSPEMFKERNELFKKYWPIEMDESYPDRLQHMRDWHFAAMEVMGKYVDEVRLREVIQYATQNIQIRSGIKEFFDFLTLHGVPIIVFSAGVTNVIDGVLKHNQIPHTALYANELGFVNGRCQLVNDGVFIGRKNWESMPRSIHSLAKDKTHKILLGDSLGDLEMGDKQKQTTSIGFLLSEYSAQGHRPVYEKSFTHVVESDTSDNGILEKIMRQLEKGA